jgi:hypothetical protein
MIAQILVCTALALVEDRPSSSVTGIDVSVEATRKSIERGLEALYAAQQENGSFGAIRTLTFNSYFANPATYHCWQIGASALATQAILQVGEGEKAVAAVDRGLDYLVKNAKVIRPAEWDIDNNWSLIYGLTTLAAAIGHPRYAGSAREPELREAAAMMIAGLKEYQGARGGWGYYADPDANWRPDWATSFTTAAALIALLDAEAVGLAVDPKVKAAAIRAVERSRLPNGSYDYDIGAVPRHLTLESINQVKGSLGRIQICNHALLRAGVDLGPDAVAVVSSSSSSTTSSSPSRGTSRSLTRRTTRTPPTSISSATTTRRSRSSGCPSRSGPVTSRSCAPRCSSARTTMVRSGIFGSPISRSPTGPRSRSWPSTSR